MEGGRKGEREGGRGGLGLRRVDCLIYDWRRKGKRGREKRKEGEREGGRESGKEGGRRDTPASQT
jgi:hypothetical protein